MQVFQLTGHIYHDLCNKGEVRMYINKRVELSFCIPQKLHKKHFPNIFVEPESIFECPWRLSDLTTPYCCW